MPKYRLPLFLIISTTTAIAAAIFGYWYGSLPATSRTQTFLQSGPGQPEPEQSPERIIFTAVGDIMLSRDVARAMSRNQDPLLPFRNVEQLLRSSDFNFANLETPITNDNTIPSANSFIFNTPERWAAGLAAYNFRALTLANNHAFDQGDTGAQQTREYLTKNGIKHVGTGTTQAEAWQGQTVTINNTRIGFLGAAYGSGASLGKSHLAQLNQTEDLKKSVAALRAEADFIVVAMHAGTEYTRNPGRQQIDFAHAAIDAGADLVIGSHPHWIQTMEKYQGKYIFYSLGNFIFDQEWSQETKEGLALKIELAGSKLKQIELIPVVIERYCCPRLATDLETKDILVNIGITQKIIAP